MSKIASITPKFADLSDAATFSGYRRRQLYEFIRNKTLRAYQPVPGGKLLIDLAELTALIKGNPHDPTAQLDKIVNEAVEEVVNGRNR